MKFATIHSGRRTRKQRSVLKGLEHLEARTLLAGDLQSATGRLVVGFEGEVVAVYKSQGAEAALSLVAEQMSAAGLSSGDALYLTPGDDVHGERFATTWQVSDSIDVPSAATILGQQTSVAYAEPDGIYTAQSIPGDASFKGTWTFGQQEHLTQTKAPQAWDVTKGDPSVVVAVIDTGVDLDHPDLNDNLLPGVTFVEGTTTPQDDSGHGTQIAGLIAAEIDNLSELAGEANDNAAWAGGIVGVAPHVKLLPIKVLNSTGSGYVSDIVAGVYYAVDPDGDPNTDDGADVINLSLGGNPSRMMADALAYAHDHGVLVIAAMGNSRDEYLAAAPYTLAVTAVDKNDVWSGTNATNATVDLSAPGVQVLTTVIDQDDPSETGIIGAYGRVSGTSMAAPIVAGAAALVKSLHPDWSPDQIAGQLLATADSVDAVNDVKYLGALGAGRVNLAAAVGPAATPRVISLRGLGSTNEDMPQLEMLDLGDTVEVRFSHAMDAASILSSDNYALTYLGDEQDPTDDQRVSLRMETHSSDTSCPNFDSEYIYTQFPGRGVVLSVAGLQGRTLPGGSYRLTVSGVQSLDGEVVAPYIHEFTVAPHQSSFAAPTELMDRIGWYLCTSDAADIDGDGDIDFVAGFENSLVWYENIDGEGNFGRPHVIDESILTFWGRRTNQIQATDFDRDGDLDIFVRFENKLLAWYENTNGRGDFGQKRTIDFMANDGINAFLADLDTDGDLDVLANTTWFENTDGQGSFLRSHELSISANRTYPADLDDDGDVDLLVAESNESLTWYENLNGAAEFGNRRRIAASVDVGHLSAADIDADGDLDVVVSLFQSSVFWFENTGRAEKFGARQSITVPGTSFYPQFVIGDIDGDNDLDVLLEDAWYENSDGAGAFTKTHLLTPDLTAVGTGLADINGDRQLDVLTNEGGWLENADGAGNFGPQHVIARELPYSEGGAGGDRGQSYTNAADLNNDGALDLLMISNNQVLWRENTDGLGTFGPERVIGNGFAEHAQAKDLDGDGDLDVLSARWRYYDRWLDQLRSDIVWRQNLDGQGNFGPPITIWTVYGDTYWESVISFDVDGDGDLDVVWSVRRAGNEVEYAWLENVDGQGAFSSPHPIDLEFISGSLNFADINGDGDLDLLLGGAVWCENSNGLGRFGSPRTVGGSNLPYNVYVVDMDGDGDQDVVAHSSAEGLAWYENVARGARFISHALTSLPTSYKFFAVTDFDGDGDSDVVARLVYDDLNYFLADSPYSFQSSRVVWYENTDGKGTFSAGNMITRNITRYMIYSFLAADLDHDGDADLLTQSKDYTLYWMENLLPHPGDANRDGRFDTTDLVQVLQAGEYEDDIEDNSTWEEGDWNGDGDFGTADLVLALQTGLYEVKSGLNASKVAAAVDWLFAQAHTNRRGKAFVA